MTPTRHFVSFSKQLVIQPRLRSDENVFQDVKNVFQKSVEWLSDILIPLTNHVAMY